MVRGSYVLVGIALNLKMNLKMNLKAVRISALLPLVVNVKAREIWSTEVSPGSLHMFIVHGNNAKAHETRVKWAVKCCQGSMTAAGDRFSLHMCK